METNALQQLWHSYFLSGYSACTPANIAQAQQCAAQVVQQGNVPAGMVKWLASNAPLALAYAIAFWQTRYNCETVAVPQVPAKFARYIASVVSYHASHP